MVWLEIEQLAEYITNEILRRIGLSGQTAKALSKSLVIVDESPFGAEKETIAKIGEINKSEGIAEVIVIGDTSICSSINEKCGIAPVSEAAAACGIYQAIERSENLYILNLSISSASRICMLSDSTLVSKAVQYAMLTGKRVFVEDIRSGFDSTKVNNGYMKKISGLKDEIEAMGIRIIGDKPAAAETAEKTARQVICLEDIKNFVGEVKIEKNSIITPLAQEYILDKKIKITTI